MKNGQGHSYGLYISWEPEKALRDSAVGDKNPQVCMGKKISGKTAGNLSEVMSRVAISKGPMSIRTF